jgi:hypothetical protein
MLGLLVYGGGEMVITFSQEANNMLVAIIEKMMCDFIL